jgi:sigma-B regulation protein RsbU (phosphoserine phosphatase)
MPPSFTSVIQDADAALLFADGHAELLTLLPTLIDLSKMNIQIVLCCDDYGDLFDVIELMEVIHVALDADPSVITGVLFGVIGRNTQLSKLRSEVGLVKSLHCSLQDDFSLIKDDLEIAATVQREFMSTEIQDVHGISFSSLWKPAGVVSGDMYDITQLDDDHVAIFIADAIGHGISAAMLAMMLMRTLSATRFDSISGEFTQPKEVLKHLNQALLERSGEHARFATAAYAIYNCKENQLTYAGAGHPPALISRFGREPILLHSQGPLLGVFEQDEYTQCTANLSIGDTLLMYSDGFEFALGENQSKINGVPTYLKSMDEFCKNSNGDVLEKITTYLNQTSPSVAEDDLTMICMKANREVSSIRLAA